MKTSNWSRRQILSAGLALATAPRLAITAEREYMISKTIPSSGESLHMETIREWQESGQIRYSGLTHYTASAHEALGREMQQFKPDFIQINYSLGARAAEERLLPMAQDLGVAVLINRPFETGKLFRAVSGIELPDWAREFAHSWGQFFLKFIISHPAVTCAIPATSKTRHMIDNLGAGMGILPDKAMRERMSDFFTSI